VGHLGFGAAPGGAQALSNIRRVMPEMPALISPTPEFLAKHRVTRPEVTRDARRETWQIETRLYRLVRRGHEGPSPAGKDWISFAEFTAANDRWYAEYAKASGASGVGEVRERVSGGGASSDGITTAQIMARAKLRAVAEFLGKRGAEILELVVIGDVTWAELARRINVSQPTAKLWACNVMRDLLTFYDEQDGVDRQGGSRVRVGIA
jgi:hypothetical protein